LFGFIAAANENTTSRASNGAPSCQRSRRYHRGQVRHQISAAVGPHQKAEDERSDIRHFGVVEDQRIKAG
jgi:hypothetical protein